MAITVDTQRRPLGAVGFDSMSSFPGSRSFADPWASTSSPAPTSTSAASATSANASLFSLGLDPFLKQQGHRAATAVSMPYTTVPVSAPSVSTAAVPVSYGPSEMLNLPNQLLSAPPRLPNESAYPSDLAYSTAPSPRTQAHVPAPPPAPSPYDALACASNRSAYSTQAQAPAAVPALTAAGDRRWSQPAVPPSAGGFLAAPVDSQRPRQTSLVDLGRGMGASASRDDYADAMNAGRSMMVLDDDNVTPRNIYDVQSREAADSYGFPAPSHSSASSVSSVSSTSPYPSYYGSVDSSVSGYSSTSESIDSGPPRGSMHRPQGSMSGSVPPAPQSMMGQFNSKVSSSAQKKHRCRVCEKRFTRPSSLRTHMYSHTGEKPFSCDVDGCGRHFSVVSNLRRHRKVHRGERDASSPEEC